jgi:ferredoxin
MSNSIIVTVDGRELSYSPSDGMLSSWAKKKGIEIETHCLQGYCGACTCKIKSDSEQDKEKLVYSTDEVIAYVNDDEIIACQSRPLQNITLSPR